MVSKAGESLFFWMRMAFSSTVSLSWPFFRSLRRMQDVGVTEVIVEAAEPDLENLEGVEVSFVGDEG
jgi:hypothetical protein